MLAKDIKFKFESVLKYPNRWFEAYAKYKQLFEPLQTPQGYLSIINPNEEVPFYIWFEEGTGNYKIDLDLDFLIKQKIEPPELDYLIWFFYIGYLLESAALTPYYDEFIYVLKLIEEKQLVLLDMFEWFIEELDKPSKQTVETYKQYKLQLVESNVNFYNRLIELAKEGDFDSIRHLLTNEFVEAFAVNKKNILQSKIYQNLANSISHQIKESDYLLPIKEVVSNILSFFNELPDDFSTVSEQYLNNLQKTLEYITSDNFQTAYMMFRDEVQNLISDVDDIAENWFENEARCISKKHGKQLLGIEKYQPSDIEIPEIPKLEYVDLPDTEIFIEQPQIIFSENVPSWIYHLAFSIMMNGRKKDYYQIYENFLVAQNQTAYYKIGFMIALLAQYKQRLPESLKYHYDEIQEVLSKNSSAALQRANEFYNKGKIWFENLISGAQHQIQENLPADNQERITKIYQAELELLKFIKAYAKQVFHSLIIPKSYKYIDAPKLQEYKITPIWLLSQKTPEIIALVELIRRELFDKTYNINLEPLYKYQQSDNIYEIIIQYPVKKVYSEKFTEYLPGFTRWFE